MDMSHEQEYFYNITSNSLAILAQDLEAACDAALLAMTKIKLVLYFLQIYQFSLVGQQKIALATKVAMFGQFAHICVHKYQHCVII